MHLRHFRTNDFSRVEASLCSGLNSVDRVCLKISQYEDWSPESELMGQFHLFRDSR